MSNDTHKGFSSKQTIASVGSTDAERERSRVEYLQGARVEHLQGNCIAGSIAATLAERCARYGRFSQQARISQVLTAAMHAEHEAWKELAPNQKEALEMIAHKIARILNGDPSYTDNWHDIAGYATLVEKQLNGEDL